MLKIAVDNQISYNAIYGLKNRKFDVVLWAGDMSDEDWVDKAIGLGANVFVSPDVDIPILLDRMLPDEKIHWIDIPQGLKSKDQLRYLLTQLKTIK